MKRITAAAIWLFYALRLRPVANRVQRWLVERGAPERPLLDFETPEEIERWISKRFQWRRDSGRLAGIVIPLDWISKPEVVQARLEQGGTAAGDCDDVHNLFRAYLEKLPPSAGVDRVYLLSSGFRREKGAVDEEGLPEPRRGGHTTCVYRQRGTWYHVDYRIRLIDDPNNAPAEVAKRFAKNTFVPWGVFEDGDGHAVAILNTRRDRLPL